MKKVGACLLFVMSTAMAWGASASTPQVEQKPIPQYSIHLESPKAEETFQSATQTLSVVVNVAPSLETGDSVVIFVDGKQSGEPSSSTSVTVPALERGSHT